MVLQKIHGKTLTKSNITKYLRKISNVKANEFYRYKRNKKSFIDILIDLESIRIIEIYDNQKLIIKFPNFKINTPCEIHVNTFENIGLYYDLYYNTGKIKLCTFCEVPIECQSNNNKFCDECSNMLSKSSYRKLMTTNG